MFPIHYRLVAFVRRLPKYESKRKISRDAKGREEPKTRRAAEDLQGLESDRFLSWNRRSDGQRAGCQ